jgi:PBP1b-binding outer membrane lipoprotein LpoB
MKQSFKILCVTCITTAGILLAGCVTETKQAPPATTTTSTTETTAPVVPAQTTVQRTTTY